MPSARDKRAAARARLEQRMAEKATAARKRRKIQVTALTALAAVLILGIGALLVVTLVNKDDDSTDTAADSGNCHYSPQQIDGTNPNMVATGTPESTQPAEGTQDFTMQTSRGDITVQLDLKAAPCTSGAFSFLSAGNYYNGSICHRLTTEGLFVLQCGDPSGTGMGGPSFSTPDENLPTADDSGYGAYPAGTVAMAEGQGQDPGSQFFIVYKDTQLPANYTRVGFVTDGLKVVTDVAKKGVNANDPNARGPGDGPPQQTVTIEGTSISDPDPAGVPVNPWTVPADGTSGSPSTKPDEDES
ncbi:peptidylprolyl isomerase [Phytomonospora endophytica]|uniref:Peptidyl-prolyl cis-trans isomerase B (Cyclophilin B) n=1 Tax=Phytomonospora endophytica TaxID=714109 RepID=A0A841G1H6_9ACTN|nr:peptidylprolyl isomerase [Phytomonospora endophytica]MBB6039507.1 peptidyl-prolyl cis-trans isomerase B (cyclophilin B) [Phytomonospora endophytica]GIG70234.1 peptidyl-prolyl cis-trans isomerase [Phytomonospora endophytica]